MRKPSLRLYIPDRDTLAELRVFDKEKFADALWAYVDAPFIIRKLYISRLLNTLKMIPERASPRILEIGAGSGILMCSLKAVGDLVVGVDSSDHLASVRRIMKQSGFDLDLVRSDVTYLPFREGSIDLTVGVSVLEHVPPENLRGVMEEINTVLSSSGYFVLGYPIESLLVRVFFRSIGFDFVAHHSSKAHEIRKAMLDVFGRIVKEKRMPLGWLPSTVSFYETVLVGKSLNVGQLIE